MGGQLNTSYIDPETGVETARNPQAQAMEYTDPMGRRQTGYSIGNRMYKDEAGTQRIENGSLVTNASGTQTWVMTDQGGVKLQEYMNGQGGKESASPSGVDYLSGAQESALNAASKRTEAGITELEAQRPEIERAYREVNRQNYQGYMQSREGLANSLASQGLYNSGYSDSAQIAQTTAYRERANATALERVRALRELETQISVARMEGSANLSELEAQYQQLMQEQWNVDRAYNYQVGRDAIGDARYDKEWEHQLEREAVGDARYDQEWNHQLEREEIGDARYDQEYADSRADTEFEQQLALKTLKLQEQQMIQNARTAAEQRAIENAYAAAEIGDFSRLKALGINTGAAEKVFALQMQEMYKSVYGKGNETEPSEYAWLQAVNPQLYNEVVGYADSFIKNQSYQSDGTPMPLERIKSLLDGNMEAFKMKYGEEASAAYGLYKSIIEQNIPGLTAEEEPGYTMENLFDSFYAQIYYDSGDGMMVQDANQAKYVMETIMVWMEKEKIEDDEAIALMKRLGIHTLYENEQKKQGGGETE